MISHHSYQTKVYLMDFYHGKLCLEVINTVARVSTLPLASPFSAACINEES